MRKPDKKAYIYLATNLINGKRYVGITAKRISYRAADHWYAANKLNSKALMHRAMRKYGREMFHFVKLTECEKYTDGIKEEVRLISILKPEYNLTAGGEGMVGYKHTPEVLKHLSESKKGKPVPWFSGAYKKAQLLQRRRIICLNDHNEFQSMKDAALHYNVERGNIWGVCNDRHEHTGRLKFAYLDEGGTKSQRIARKGNGSPRIWRPAT